MNKPAPLAYRVLICGALNPDRGPLWPASAWMSEPDAMRFAREWLAFDSSRPVRVAPGRAAATFAYVGA